MRDSDRLIQDAPLLAALVSFAKQDRFSLHMPGHQAGAGFPELIRHHLADLDVTELSVTDDLNAPTGPAAAAMKEAAAAFGAMETFFVTGGSTTALFAMVAAFCPRGSKIVLPRTVHRAVLNISAILALRVVFLPAEKESEKQGHDDSTVPFLPTMAGTLRDVLARHPDTKAVLITSPDYYGVCQDLASLSTVAREAGCPLLVDEAHGAHLCFAPHLLPPSALASGAAACVQSAHKTLPALTQGAYLHLGNGAAAWADPVVLSRKLRDSLTLFQTSSASLMIGATLDYARSFMSHKGLDAIMATRQAIDRFARSVPATMKVTTVSRRTEEGIWRDPLRVVLEVSGTGRTGLWWSGHLAASGFDVEMADLVRIVLIPGLATEGRELDDLARFLLRSDETRQVHETSRAVIELDQRLNRRLTQSPRPFWHATAPLLDGWPCRIVPPEHAVGFSAARAILAYPPGIALVWPGERLDTETLALLQDLSDNGICLHGCTMSGEEAGVLVIDTEHSVEGC